MKTVTTRPRPAAAGGAGAGDRSQARTQPLRSARPRGASPATRPDSGGARPAGAARTRPAPAGRALVPPAAGDERWRLLWERVLAGLEAAQRRSRSQRRTGAVLVLWIVLSLALGWRLVDVQVIAADEYRRDAIDQTHRDLQVPPVRGRLLDREGTPLAMSVRGAAVYANPRTIAQSGQDPNAIAAQLAGVLGAGGVPADPAAITARLTGDQGFAYVARQVPREVGEAVMALRPALPGIGILDEPVRTYPAGDLAATVVGFAGIDNHGLSGLEIQYDDVLRGEPGLLQIERAPGGVEITAAPRVAVPAVPGTDVALTLDRDIQATAEASLRDVVERTQADGGAAVVMDVESGELLAMASMPDVVGGERQGNLAITAAYEPGSVQKVVTVAAALEEGLVTPDTMLDVPESVVFGDHRFREEHLRPGPASVREILARSSNVGSILIGEQLGPERLHDYAERFGYGRPTGLTLPGENTGILPPVAGWSATTLPTVSIGHGLSANLLQVGNVYATIARGGEWVQPSLVRGTIGPGGDLQHAVPPERHRVVSADTAASLREMLAGVITDEGGTGELAAIPGYTVAGKTGTARKPGPGGYEAGAYIATFAGFAPVEDPRLVVAVMIDEPREGSYYAGEVAAPVFQEVMQFALSHLRVPPSQAVEAEEQPAPPNPTPTPAPPAP